MDILIAVLAVLLTLVGIAGCILPGLPGPPINFLALILIHWQIEAFSQTTLWVMGILALVVIVLDYAIPVWSARLFGATKTGVRWSIYGMLIGLFFTPVGMMTGLFAGAILGDMQEGKSPLDALKAGIGTYLGTLIGIVVKCVVALIISFPVWYVLSVKAWQAVFP